MKANLFMAIAIMMFINTSAQNIVWQKNYGGTGTDIATCIVPTSDGGFITGGYTNSNNGDVTGHKNGDDIWILKLNATGAIQWKRTYGGSNDDRCFSIIQAADGNYVFAGTTNSSNGNVTNNKGAFDGWVVKINTSGTIIWQRTLGGSDDEIAYDIVQAANGDYIVCGDTKTDQLAGIRNKGGYDFYITRLNGSGSIVWQRLYGGSDDESAKSVDILINGDIVVGGETESNNGNVSGNKGGHDFWVLRLTPAGSLGWARTYGGTNSDQAHSLTATSDGGLIVAGETESNNGNVPGNRGSDDYWVLKLTNTGSVTWSKTYGGETSDIARSIQQLKSGGYIVVGESESKSGNLSSNFGGDDYWFIKISASGNLESQKNYGGSSTDVAYAVAEVSSNNYVIAGRSQSKSNNVTGNRGNDDYWIVRTSLTTASRTFETPLTMENTSKSSAVSLYPNPAIKNTTINADENIRSIQVYDVTGRLRIQTPVNRRQYTLSLTGLEQGMYNVQCLLESGNYTVLSLMKN